jgi:hypothetical protein
MALTPGWQEYANYGPITPINQAFPSAAPSTSTSPKPTGMDPLTAGLGIASIGTSIAGLFGQQSAADKQADAVKKAAEEQRKAVEQASKIGAQLQLAQVGLNWLENRYRGGQGGALDRFNLAQDQVMQANTLATNPAVMAARAVERYDRKLNEAMPGRLDPTTLFS